MVLFLCFVAVFIVFVEFTDHHVCYALAVVWRQFLGDDRFSLGTVRFGLADDIKKTCPHIVEASNDVSYEVFETERDLIGVQLILYFGSDIDSAFNCYRFAISGLM